MLDIIGARVTGATGRGARKFELVSAPAIVVANGSMRPVVNVEVGLATVGADKP